MHYCIYGVYRGDPLMLADHRDKTVHQGVILRCEKHNVCPSNPPLKKLLYSIIRILFLTVAICTVPTLSQCAY
jgi:hypothetical protein